MTDAIPLLATAALPPGESAEIVADGRIFAVYNVGGEFRVMDGICPHAGGPLGKGALNDGVVTCPWHGWQFDVSNGQHCLNETLCQETFPVKIIDGQVCIVKNDD